jgi:hypothetical protein
VLEYDRRLEIDGLLALAPEAEVNAQLVDESTRTVQTLGSEQVTDRDGTFERSRFTVPEDTLVVGRSYRIQSSSSPSPSAPNGCARTSTSSASSSPRRR